jgi:manganese-dependent inorganic pyrophosphatase
MENVRKSRGCDLILLMLTQIIDAGTLLLYVGEGAEDLLARAFTGFELRSAEHYIVLPGVMSRKKQVVPNISAVLD